jgi:catechol 2,3-dioxygenase-like lactoylglutathione lyase family enzyme
MISAKPHHIGCAVKQLEDSCATYAAALGLNRRSRPFDVVSQQVRVCFVELGSCFYLELISPLNERAKLASFLQTGFYHLCFLVEDLGRARDYLRGHRYLALPPFESEAFAGNVCQFFLSPQKHLIELAQMSTGEFNSFFSENLDA